MGPSFCRGTAAAAKALRSIPIQFPPRISRGVPLLHGFAVVFCSAVSGQSAPSSRRRSCSQACFPLLPGHPATILSSRHSEARARANGASVRRRMPLRSASAPTCLPRVMMFLLWMDEPLDRYWMHKMKRKLRRDLLKESHSICVRRRGVNGHGWY